VPPLDHWQPVLRSSDLGKKPKGITLCGKEYVVFRDGAGAIGALSDVCPHRGMRLSRGWVEGERLVCPYHGWSFDARGAGESPGTPKLRTCAPHLEAVERYDAIWVKAEGATARFPVLEPDGYHRVSVLRQRVKAPLLAVLDNFTEVEHTGTAHMFFGYPVDALGGVQTKVEVTDDTVRVINTGPQKWIPWPVERLFGIRTGDAFTDDWTTYFSPVHVVYDQWWADPKTGEARPKRLRLWVFFTPVDEDTTDLHVCIYSTARPWGRLGLNQVIRRILAGFVRLETFLDKRIVEHLADKSPELRGRKLGRFDKALGENRRRLAQISYGAASASVG
jgi:vanillate O-demethylase monooxygenase subunit